MKAAEGRWMGAIAQLPCCVGHFTGAPCEGRVEVHHVAEGSGKRSGFSVASLCSEHHRGATGLHGMGWKRFCAAYRVPGETEYGLLVWTNELLESTLWKMGRKAA